MHTVFINTTKNSIGGRFDALKSARDLKKLMYVDCPLDAWYDEEKGYQEVARKIAEYIDTYNDVGNDYNLVIYVDMLSFFELLKIRFFETDSVQQTFVSKLCKAAVSRLMAATILEKLTEDGRIPSEKAVLLLELPATKEEPSGIDPTARQTEAMQTLLHLLPMEQLQQKLTEGKDKTAVPLAELVDEVQPGLKIDLCKIYEANMRIMADSVTLDGVSLQRACNDLYGAIEHHFKVDCTNNLAISEYHTNKRTQRLSLEVYTKHNFLLQAFILDCINSETVFDADGTVKQIPELSEQEWDAVKEKLYRKKRLYEVVQKKIANLSVDFTQLMLAPTLYMPAREKFGLNENGLMHTEFVTQEVTSRKKKKKGEKTAQADDLTEKRQELVEQRGVVQNLILPTEYKPYDSTGDAYDPAFGRVTADEYCKRATDLANHHLNLFNKLNLHIKRAMANYSSRSISNAAPVLRKRSVNMGQSVDDGEKNDYKYAKRNGANLVPEVEPTETVIETSKRSYISLMLEYLKFDAGRGIAMVNIKRQCDWFINRIRQIEESLKKLLWIFVVLCVTLAVVYLPFVLIQWNAITKNVDTVLVALGSLAIPYAFMFLFYFIARAIQVRKMEKAWEDLVKKSNEACEENRKLIAAYDLMMTRYIPALRWIYEYVLDVDFHCDCCETARAKLAHHRDKLLELIESLGNFLEDLDYAGKPYTPTDTDQLLDYNNAFCEGELNRSFYAIIDAEILDMLQKRQGGFA
ncbi:MAG: hypothetical protein IJO72_06225 [Oscillospiraceae bacterium]|nr:hypothetical protein [Oscillospiraceae bacterium]